MKNILFVGNSYTYYNDMPEVLFAQEACHAGIEVNVTAVTKGGYYLDQFADPENEHGKRLRETVAGKKYDCIILQDQSMNPIKDEKKFLDSVGAMKRLLGAHTDRFVLYATWGRKTGSPQLDELGLDTEQMARGLSEAYNKAGKMFGMDVAEVGKAFLRYSAERPDADLYNPDLSHPSELGSAVAARVIFSTVFGK